MTHARGLVAVLLLGAGATPAPAQLVVGFGSPGFTIGRSTLGGYYYSRRPWLSAYLSGGYPFGGYGSLFGRYGGATYSSTMIVLNSPPPTPVVINQPITIINNNQPAAAPAEEGVVVRPRPQLLVDRRALERKGIFAPQREEIAPPEGPPDEPPLPGQPAGRFRKVNPEDRPGAAPAPREALPQPRPPREPAPRPPAEEAPADETARHVAQGKEAFAAGQYGLAARRFRQATASGPKDPLGHFLLAQARFALGKYAEAVASIQAGMRINPEWPAADFRPADLYGRRAADFTQQLQLLRDTLDQAPQDPVLLFLLGYELWFDDRRGDAVPLFQRAAATAPDKTFINAFLRGR
jgi:hypothetical protein